MNLKIISKNADPAQLNYIPGHKRWECNHLARASYLSSIIFFIVFSAQVFAQDADDLSNMLNFETKQTNNIPAGWILPAKAAVLDGKIVHGGKWSTRIERDVDDGRGFSGISKIFPLDFEGKTIQLKAFGNAPQIEPIKTAIDNDHEFDAGSRFSIESLTSVQLENITALGKIWGFLKYHHPLITSGQRHWDYDLLRVLPTVLTAPDRATANVILHKWINNLGDIVGCKRCASLKQNDLYLPPALDWIHDSSVLGEDLSGDLQKVYRNRPTSDTQFYLKQVKNNGSPEFLHELSYKNIQFPDVGFQILALFRFWNIIEYWAPYRNVIDDNWDAVLRQSLTKIALAKDNASYRLEMMALIAHVKDTHANLWGTRSLALRPPTGNCHLPLYLRFVENNAVVAGYTDDNAGKATGLKLGDIIESLDAISVSELIKTWAPYYAASNQVARLRDMAGNLTRGACGVTKLLIRNEHGQNEIQAIRTPIEKTSQDITHDRAGNTFQLLADNIAYIKLSSIKRIDIPSYIKSAKRTKGLIIDLRNYPSEFVVFDLGQHLIKKPTDFVRLTTGDLNNPGAFYWSSSETLLPKKPFYAGKVILLIDELTQSQAEYTTMAFRAAPGAKVIGSTTAGADGNVSPIPLPGGLNSLISGIGVFYPDKRPTQRVGIIPDIEIEPTIAGIRAGRDEILGAAMAKIREK